MPMWKFCGCMARTQKKTADLHSDYDLAVAFKHFIEDPVERRLRPELLALQWAHETGVEISVIDINQVPLPLAYTVVQDNYLLYSDNDYRRMIEEQKIMSKWELDYCIVPMLCVGMHV